MGKDGSITIILYLVGTFFISINAANAEIFDWFSKDSCKAYSDYTCKQLENSQYNAYFYFPTTQNIILAKAIV
tara:strand:+ start:102 stop:320 length:219 start_codon:yes stop_codon:yes gene_type:complete